MKATKTKIMSAIAILMLMAVNASHADTAVSDTPLLVNTTVAPNIIMTLDDSTSMGSAYTEDVGTNSLEPFTSNYYNKMAYNPAVKYEAPTRLDDVVYSTSFANAYINGLDPSRGYVDLSAAGYKPTQSCYPQNTSCTNLSAKTYSEVAAVSVSYNCRFTFTKGAGTAADTIKISGCTIPTSGNGSFINVEDSRLSISIPTNGTYSKDFIKNTSTVTSSGGVYTVTLADKNQFSATSSSNLAGTISWNDLRTQNMGNAPAYYHRHYTELGMAKPSGCNSITSASCYKLVISGSTDDVTPGTASQKKQNFANWYSFYRTRALIAMSASTDSIGGIGNNKVRFGWQTINGCKTFGTNCQGYDRVNRENRIRYIDDYKTGSTSVTHRSDFYNWVARFNLNGSTPLRSAFDRVGQFYSTSGINSPYAEDPYITKGLEIGCRRNYHMAFTDGFWNGDDNFNSGEHDASSKQLPDGKSYSPRAPYRSSTSSSSGYSNTNNLADIAFNYWSKDLRSDIPNKVPKLVTNSVGTDDQVYWNPKNNPATWQHMTNINIAFALGDQLTDPLYDGDTYGGDYPKLLNGTEQWPPTKANDVSAVYDLWHAAINSRGQFYAANDGVALKEAFNKTFSQILATTAASSSLTSNSTSIQAGSKIYQARFQTADWGGQLFQYEILADGSISYPAKWDAAQKLSSMTPDSRNIITSNADGAVPLRWSSLSGSQQGLLTNNISGQDRVDWVRGSKAKEGVNSSSLRQRSSLLGAIINSNPTIMGVPQAGYREDNYSQFVLDNRSREKILFAGASDGMLHAFDADSGVEKFAYMPEQMFNRIPYLSSQSYTHKYGVDGSPKIADAYTGTEWKTLLASTMGNGAPGMFVLDVTNPDNFTESNASSIFYSEFTNKSDDHLGLYSGRMNIVKMGNDKWAAVFGNGINANLTDATKKSPASIFIVMLDGKRKSGEWVLGTNYYRIDFPITGAGANGMTSVVTVDDDRDGKVDFIYGTDSLGNVWRADVNSSTPSLWRPSFTTKPIFTAKDSASNAQPIIGGGLEVVRRPEGGRLVLFGTGQYLNAIDTTTTSVQSLYGILDTDTTGTVVRSQLQKQEILSETSSNGYDWRKTTVNDVDYEGGKRGWYMDLTLNNVKTGERVVYEPVIRGTRVIFSTLSATSDVCTGGGDSWLMELDALTGKRLETTPFDINGDKSFTSADLINFGDGVPAVVSGRKSTIGITPRPSVIIDPSAANREYKIMSGSSGRTETIRESNDNKLGRITWREIQR